MTQLTLHGHSLWDISSMLQKAIRRCDFERAGYAAYEMYGDFDYTPDVATFTFTLYYDIFEHYQFEIPIYGAVKIDNPLLDYFYNK